MIPHNQVGLDRYENVDEPCGINEWYQDCGSACPLTCLRREPGMCIQILLIFYHDKEALWKHCVSTNNPITQSTVSKIESKFRETGDVKYLPKCGRPKITRDKKIDIVLSMEENPQSTSTLVASENEVSQTTVLRILRKENYHPYKFQLVQELNEDDPDRQLQF
ncbi:hypothetical protein NQ318_003175, partial [Aromia moschata]